jgi:hypothetical protein
VPCNVQASLLRSLTQPSFLSMSLAGQRLCMSCTGAQHPAAAGDQGAEERSGASRQLQRQDCGGMMPPEAGFREEVSGMNCSLAGSNGRNATWGVITALQFVFCIPGRLLCRSRWRQRQLHHMQREVLRNSRRSRFQWASSSVFALLQLCSFDTALVLLSFVIAEKPNCCLHASSTIMCTCVNDVCSARTSL